MPNTSEQWFVPLEEPNEPITIYGGQRGGGKIFALENIIAFLKESLNQANQETERWKSAALYYHEILATAPKWIPVTERLPEAGIEVLAMLQVNKFDGHDTHNVVTAVFMPCDSWLVEDYLEGIEAETTGTDCEDCCYWITHWMPLPQPPKGE